MSTIVKEATRRTASSFAATERPFELALPAASSKPATRRDELLRDIHWTRPDGRVCFAPAKESPSDAAHRRAHLSEAVDEFGDPDLRRIAQVAQSREGKPAATIKGLPKPAPSYHCEALRSSVLRTDWSTKAVQLAVDWSRPALELELSVGRDVVLAGTVPPNVVVNGHVRTAVGSWDEVCWDTDAEADYLELELALDGGLWLQRQFVLLRRDGLLWIADAVLGQSAANLECSLMLPFAPQTVFTPADETQEIRAALGRQSLTILPPALAEWRVDQSGGDLSSVDGAVRLRRTAQQAVAVYAPLCLVVDSRRAKRECTWRRLTIGEDRQIQSVDKAVGYRLQLGREQWLFYRSLTSRANRTLLGANLQSDFLCARLKRHGEIETLMEIEE